MPSIFEIKNNPAYDQCIGWTRVYEAMKRASKQNRMTITEFDLCLRLNPGIQFETGTTLQGILNYLQEKKMIKVTKKSREQNLRFITCG